MPLVAWIVFVAAALLEVGGDAVVRKALRARAAGLHDTAALLIPVGGLMLAAYGVVVNAVKWDFSKLLGVYVAVFAVVSVLMGKYFFAETIPLATWIGVALIVLGGLVIQFGSP